MLWTMDAMADHSLRARMLEFQTTEYGTNVSSPSSSSIMRNNEQAAPVTTLALIPSARALLDAMSKLLHSAEREIQQLERDNILGTAVIRACAEIADLVAHVASQLEDQTDSERRHFAAACLQDFQSSPNNDSLRLTVEDDILPNSSLYDTDVRVATSNMLVVEPLSDTNEDNAKGALGQVATLLRDMEFSLRSMDADDASDLADTALIVAQLGLAALHNIHSQLVHYCWQQEQEDNNDRNESPFGRTSRNTTGANFSSSEWKGSPNIILLSDDDDDDCDVKPRLPLNDKDEEPIPQSPPLINSSSRSPRRMRCLWPPLKPEAIKILQWSRGELQKHHWIWSAALGLTFWPVWTTTAVIGSSALVVDAVLQRLYQQWEDTAFISSAEYAATSVFLSAKLTLLSAKAIVKPTLRVARRQLQRHGPAVHEWTRHKIAHPVETLCETAHGAAWCLQQVCGMVAHKWNEWQPENGLQPRESVSIHSERHQSAQELHL
jgi:hypothetical protein